MGTLSMCAPPHRPKSSGLRTSWVTIAQGTVTEGKDGEQVNECHGVDKRTCSVVSAIQRPGPLHFLALESFWFGSGMGGGGEGGFGVGQR